MRSLNYADKIDELKQDVQQMLEERRESFDSQLPSPLWQEVLILLKYIMNLSAEDFLNIRYHAGLVTGCQLTSFWHQYPPVDPETYASGYKFLTKGVPDSYWIGEPPMPKYPRPIGLTYQGKILNPDVVRYQACISNLYTMGVLEFLQKRGGLILEVGAGFGGLAHHLSRILPNCTYVIVDLPEMLLFSGGFLIVNNDKNIYIYEKKTFTPEFLAHSIYNYDFVLLPNYVLKALYAVSEINLMINLQSFQEMTREQVYDYVEFGYSKLSGPIYSDNIDVHPCNHCLAPDTVEKILAKRFALLPPPEVYNKIPSSRDPWFYKQYFGGSEGGVPLFRFYQEQNTMKIYGTGITELVFEPPRTIK